MKHIFLAILRGALKLIPRRAAIVVIEQLFLSLKENPLRYAYNRLGILPYENNEFILLEKIAPFFLSSKETVVFDVGANIGDYTEQMKKSVPHVQVYSFEPNPLTYKKLVENVGRLEDVTTVNLAFGDSDGVVELNTYENHETSGHATIFEEVILDIHGSESLKKIEVDMTTLDKFCAERNIDFIDFLKIDTEGAEVRVLTGAKRLLSEHRIKMIQFEFNEMNIISRSFLKDFYDLLEGYQFYRMDKKLIDLGPYNTMNEILQFQNILAISKELKVPEEMVQPPFF